MFPSQRLVSQNTPNTGAFANIIQVRMQDTAIAGTTTYWEADIAYNTTAFPAATVDGTTVPANGWALIFPFNTATTTTLGTNAVAGHVNTGSNVILTATTPAGDAGSVNFYNGTTLLGNVPVTGTSAAFTVTAPANGSYAYTATFVPAAGDESNIDTSTATFVNGSTSTVQNVNVGPAPIQTTNTVGADNLNPAFGGTVNLTDQVAEPDSPVTAGLAGTVQFLDNGSNFGAVQTTNGTGLATLTTTSLTGSNVITAVFTPTSTSYAGGASSNNVTVVVQAQTICASPSVCSEPQNIQVTVNPGTITISTPYTNANPFVLNSPTLSSDGTYLSSSTPFPQTSLPGSQQIVVTSQLSPAYAWTLSVEATNLTCSIASCGGTGGTISSTGLGLIDGTLLNPAPGAGTYPGTVTFGTGAAPFGIPSHNPSLADPDTNTGLLPATPQTFAKSTAADGTAEMSGMLTLLTPTNIPSGLYTGTLTFSVS